ncbi:MAG: beta strand repeat-containing protein [Candidatus Spyradosoma sp.]
MKNSKLFLTSLLAAAAMGATTAWANSYANQTISTDTTATYTNNKYDDSNLVSGDTVINENCTWTWGTNNGSGHGLIKQTGTLSGAGTWLFTRTQTTDADYGRFLLLSGDNSAFTGTFQLTSSNADVTKGPNVALLLGGLNAATNATINLGQCTGVAFASDVTSANVGGFVGTSASSWILAKSSTPTGSVQSTNKNGSWWEADATEQTINLTGSGEYAFAGRVGNAVSQTGTLPNPYTLSINKTGTGKQTFSGLVDLKNLSVSAGELVLSGTATIAGTTTVSGGTLSLAGALNLSSAISVAGSGNVTVADTLVFDLSALTGTTSGTTTTFSLISGKTLGEDWTALGLSNIDIVSANVGTRNASAVFSDDGSVAITAERADLIWNGTSENSTWNTETSNKIWTNNDLATEDKADGFYMLDNVTFGSSASSKSVSLVSGAAIQAGTVEVTDDYAFTTTSGTSTLKGSKLTVASGATLNLGNGDSKTVALDFDDISLSGKIRYQNNARTWKKLTFAADGAELFIYDLDANVTGLTVTELEMAANGKITAEYGGTVALGSITGAGDLSISGPNKSETLTFTIGSLSGSGKISTVAGTGTGALNVEIGGDNSSFTGTLEINAGTVKLTSSSNTLGATDIGGTGTRYAAVVKTGGTLDINGQTEGGNNCYKIELAGGSLVNNGSNVGTYQRQITGLKLSADSTVGGSGNFGLIANGYAVNTLDLGGYTLTKTGSNNFWLTSTTVKDGVVDVQAGYLYLSNGDGGDEKFAMESDATLKANGGEIKAGSAGVALGNVAIVFSDTNTGTARITADTSCSFNAAGATLYLDIGALTETVLTGEEVALTIAAGNAIDSFFSAVEVGTYVDDAWQISSEWKYSVDTWSASLGTLTITAIPEPSLFGLLAGLGALALAGSRRRRRKA